MKAVALLFVLLASACAAPASVEGVFSNSPFTLRSSSPLSKPSGSGRDMVIVLSDYDSETLSTVNLTLSDFATMPVAAPVALAPGAVDVVVGDLVVETRDDGVELITTGPGARRARSVAGTVTLDERDADVIAGSFRVDLDDGGYLDGVFAASPSE